MNSKYILAFVLLTAVIVSGCNNAPQTTDQGQAMEDNNDAGNDQTQDQTDSGNNDLTVGEFTITRTDSDFEPPTLTIKVGSTVNFVNNSNTNTWPASARHPTHTAYPGSGILKCGSGENIFDACVWVEPGDSYSFIFNEVGEWAFHDHLLPSKVGKIIVVE